MVICNAFECKWNTRQHGIDTPTTCTCPAIMIKFVNSDVPVCTNYKEVKDNDRRYN